MLICAAVPRPAAAQSAITKLTLPDGARVLIQPDSNSDFVAICVFVRAGVAEESIPGVGNVTSRALFGSNYNQSADAVAHTIYQAGGSLTTEWNPDYTLITCVTTHTGFSDAFYVIGQAIKNAEFEPDVLDRAKSDALADITREESDPFRAAYAALRSETYHDSPYRVSFGGTAETLRRITRSVVLRYFRERYTPGNTVIAIVGDISLKEAQKTAENQLIDYDRPPPTRPTPSLPPEAFEEGLRVVHTLPIHTTLILAGFRAPGLTDPDYPAFTVLDAIVGGGKSSRLFRQIRDTAGIGYAVDSETPPLAHESRMLATVEYDPDRKGPDGKILEEATVEKLLQETVQSVLKTPPTPQEVERAKRYAAGAHALAHQRVRERAFHLGWYELMGVGYAFDTEFPKRLAAVTPEDVSRVAKKYLTRCAISVVQPERPPDKGAAR